MILPAEITEAGRFNKPHGIKGEISATLDIDVDLAEVKCLVMDVEGIFVPFFVKSVRPKTAETCLVTLDGVDSEEKARRFASRAFFILKTDLPESEEGDDEGFYAADLVGYEIKDAALGTLGEVTDINDVTDNVLFVVTSPDGHEILLPVADEFILYIDTDARVIETDYPEGILDLNH